MGVHPKIQFTAETETDHALNYLDITIHRTPTNFRTAIHRKPTFTDTSYHTPPTTPHTTYMLLFDSCHSRLNSYNVQHEEYQHELNTIHDILQNNSFPIKPHTLKPAQPKDPITPQKRASFTYISKETSDITNIFRRTDLKIALHTRNTTGNLLTHKSPTQDI
jgi:hypothetical protein